MSGPRSSAVGAGTLSSVLEGLLIGCFSLLFVYFKEILYSRESVFSFFVHSHTTHNGDLRCAQLGAVLRGRTKRGLCSQGLHPVQTHSSRIPGKGLFLLLPGGAGFQ